MSDKVKFQRQQHSENPSSYDHPHDTADLTVSEVGKESPSSNMGDTEVTL